MSLQPPGAAVNILDRESLPCALCGGERFVVVLSGARDWIGARPGEFTLARCEGCGLIATRPRPTRAALALYYEGAYSGSGDAGLAEHELGVKGPGRLVNGYRLHVIDQLRKLGENDTLLDVGCSYGGLMWLARKRAGCATVGVDLDEGALNAAHKHPRASYHHGVLTELGLEAGRFNLITFMECLEHDLSPVETLREAKRLLAEGGVIAIEVPCWEGLWRPIFGRFWLPLLMPQHLHHFSPASLRACVEAAGLEVIDQRAMFFPAEATLSLGQALGAALGLPAPGAAQSAAQRVLGGVIGLVLALFWLFVELPAQLLMWLLNRTGHMMLIARAPQASPR
ncbi:MAG: class I SAM-dependent methyltransferase [Deltaproteobacteria bacterium]|nr:class I SAM-dependent methyltransferase [Deltaproteobacteria bacterium]